jgi:hypothetical protein
MSEKIKRYKGLGSLKTTINILDIERNCYLSTEEIIDILNKYNDMVENAKEMMKNSKILKFANKVLAKKH